MQYFHDRFLSLKTAPHEENIVKYITVQYMGSLKHSPAPDIRIISNLYEQVLNGVSVNNVYRLRLRTAVLFRCARPDLLNFEARVFFLT